MVEQAKQRVMRTGFFKTVKIEKEKGSAPDRTVLTVNVEEQQTGELPSPQATRPPTALSAM